ncbi:MAG: 2Fe-2S iron-sulfur cluster-binding protein [Vampirovibrionales bacterium]|nr:2Fe-2S iron-sulfur cluster-binding protein [Vampirovibrionales bacterium]
MTEPLSPASTIEVTFEPDGITLAVDAKTTLREAAHLAGVDVHDRCGGLGACCNCVVTVIAGAEHLSAKTELEAAVFYLDPDDRLSCQCYAHGPVTLKTT